MSLYPFQERAVQFHLAHHYSLNFSEMGLGKSRMALMTALKAGHKKVTIFAPAFLKSTWKHEVEVVGGLTFEFVAYSKLSSPKKVNPNFSSFWICDEAHFLKNPRAIRTQTFYSLLKTQLPEYWIGLTGTPIKNRVPDLWTQFAFCQLNQKGTSGIKLEGELTHFGKFCRHFCHAEMLRINGARIPKFTGLKEEKTDELKSLLKGKVVRYRIDEIGKELPPLTRVTVPVDVSGKADLELEQAFKNYMAGNKRDISAKVRSASLKALKTAEFVQSLLDDDSGPVLVYSDHIEPVKTITRTLKGVSVASVTGATPMEARQDAVNAFQRGALSALVATIGSLSVGVTLTKARHVVFNDMSWTPADNLQAEKRIHRIGQTSACFAYFITATATDSHIQRTLNEKLETISKVME